MRRGRMLALALLVASSCGGSGLDGSLSEAFDLSYSSVVIRRSPTALQVSYLRSSGNEVVIRLTVDLEGIDLRKTSTIDLAAEYAPGHGRAAVSRAVEGEPVRQLPSVATGTLNLNSVPDPGSACSGDFSLAFGKGGDLGAGRTLEGKFSAVVQGSSF